MTKKRRPHDRLVEAASHFTRAYTLAVMGIQAMEAAKIDATDAKHAADGLLKVSRVCLAEAI